MRVFSWIRAAVLLPVLSCSSRPELPAPTYQKPVLPPWEAPPPPADPLDAPELSGDWVEDTGDGDSHEQEDRDVSKEPELPSKDEPAVLTEEETVGSGGAKAVEGGGEWGGGPENPLKR